METGEKQERKQIRAAKESLDIRYSQLAEELKQKLRKQSRRKGERFASEHELSAEYGVSRHTVRKALAILEEEGFIYAVHGKGTFCTGLRQQARDSHNIAVVMTYLSDYIFPRVIEGIDKVLTGEGYSIILKNTRNSSSAEGRCLEELLDKDIDGLIIEPSKSDLFSKNIPLFEQLQAQGVPCVMIQGKPAQLEDIPSVVMDDAEGGYLLTRHLIEKGRKRILGIFKADDSQGRERHKGYVRALQEGGLLYDPELVIWFHTEDRAVKPFAVLRRMCERGGNFDAAVCYNDQIAVRVIQNLKDMGKRVPEDVAVTGYDNSFLADGFETGLTTVAHPQEELGEDAARLLLRLIHGEDIAEEEKHILIEPALVVRGSSG